jgi:hypothetical protein
MNSEPPTSRFVTRLSYGMMAVIGILAALSIRNQLSTAWHFSADGLRGVRSAHDVAVLEQLNWALLVLVVAIWSVLIFASWSLGRRRNWARRAVIFVFGFLVLAFAWNSGIGLLFTFGVLRLPFLQPGYSGLTVHGVLSIVTLTLIACGYMCWLVIRRLRSAEIRCEFSA